MVGSQRIATRIKKQQAPGKNRFFLRYCLREGLCHLPGDNFQVVARSLNKIAI